MIVAKRSFSTETEKSKHNHGSWFPAGIHTASDIFIEIIDSMNKIKYNFKNQPGFETRDLLQPKQESYP